MRVTKEKRAEWRALAEAATGDEEGFPDPRDERIIALLDEVEAMRGLLAEAKAAADSCRCGYDPCGCGNRIADILDDAALSTQEGGAT